jgi:arylformamidase
MSAAVDPWHEREYNPRVLVPDAVGIYAAWPARALATRTRHPPTTHRYGEHPREVLDLFRPADPRGCVLFIHGGYFRAFSKDDFSWVADAFLARGLSVALLTYPLCPDVALPRIAEATRRAFVALHRDVLDARERRGLVVAGHSAGGYLAALHLATDWAAHGLPADPLAGAVPISGVFDLAPLIHTTMNEALRLDPDVAATLALTGTRPRSRAPLALVVGGAESAEFHRQSSRLAADWAELSPTMLDVPGRNHFDVLDELVDARSDLFRTIVGMSGA